jgi:hypothetical protein
MPCPQFIIWGAAILLGVHEFVGYELFIDGDLIYEGPERRVEYCFNETDTYTIEVVTVVRKIDGLLYRSMHSFNSGTLAELAPLVTSTPSPTITPTPTPIIACADLDGDGVVGFLDHLILAQQYGGRCE